MGEFKSFSTSVTYTFFHIQGHSVFWAQPRNTGCLAGMHTCTYTFTRQSRESPIYLLVFLRKCEETKPKETHTDTRRICETLCRQWLEQTECFEAATLPCTMHATSIYMITRIYVTVSGQFSVVFRLPWMEKHNPDDSRTCREIIVWSRKLPPAVVWLHLYREPCHWSGARRPFGVLQPGRCI